jgi:large subunit ribosomal protein L27
MTHGKVYVTCERVDLNYDKEWVQNHFAGRADQKIYKKYFNVIPEKQHQRFRLIDEN